LYDRLQVDAEQRLPQILAQLKAAREGSA